MAANYLKLSLLLTNLLVFSACSANKTEAGGRDDTEVLNYLVDKTRQSLSRLENEIKRCSDLSRSNQFEDLELLDDLKSEFGKEAILNGVGNLHFRNLLGCEYSERKDLSYHYGALRSITHSDVNWPDDIRSIPESLIYPDRREVELEIRYQKLPSKLRESLTDIFGDKPFDLIKVLDYL